MARTNKNLSAKNKTGRPATAVPFSWQSGTSIQILSQSVLPALCG